MTRLSNSRAIDFVGGTTAATIRAGGFMLKSGLLHPQILAALGRAGHNSKVLISDGNFPHWTKRGPNAEVVFLNVAPGLVGAVDVLKVLVGAIPIESAAVMDYQRQGPHAQREDPPIWNDFRQILGAARL